MPERKETTEQFGVIFALWDGKNLQLEKRLKQGSKYFGLIIIPGGGVEADETYQMAMVREVKEEYGVRVKSFEQVGVIREMEGYGITNIRHVFLVRSWYGRLSNPEELLNESEHIQASFEEARIICEHPVTQRVLDLIEARLSRDN